MRRSITIFVLLTLFGLPGVTGAAPPRPENLVELRVERASIPEDRGALEVEMVASIAEGWHVNAHEPTLESLIPTELSIAPPEGWTVGAVEYPEPERYAFSFAQDRELAVYSGDTPLRFTLSGTGPVAAEGVSFEAVLRYQACDDERCLRPAEVKRSFQVRPTSTGTQPGQSNITPVGDWLADLGLVPTLFLVALMGLGLNLTPCVYPLISVTLAYFGRQAQETRSRVVFLSSVYALGIAVTFSILGVVASLTGGLFGAFLQHPATLIGIAVLMVLLAFASFGFYTLRVPTNLVQRAGGTAGGVLGALFMGLTMGVVAAPCVGPIVVGLLMAVASQGDAFLGFLLFFTLAVGLGAPYVVLGAAAGSLSRLPRSGEWLTWVEHLFGFLLLGLALYFVSSLLPAPWLPWIVAGFVATAGVALGFLDSNGNRIRSFRAFKRVGGVALAGSALWLAWPQPHGAPEVEWQAYSAEALENAREVGRPAVIDFRADWCIPCIEMEHTTFRSTEVVDLSQRFAMLQADVTTMSEEAETMLARHDILGVPTALFFDESGREVNRVVGYIGPKEFKKLLKQTLNSHTKADAAARHGMNQRARQAALGDTPGPPQGSTQLSESRPDVTVAQPSSSPRSFVRSSVGAHSSVPAFAARP